MTVNDPSAGGATLAFIDERQAMDAWLHTSRNEES
jgi:hypothetical protein